MAWPYDDDLISKLRSNINNGSSIGMSGGGKKTLADLANLEARLNPDEAEDILGRAADDIGFGASGKRSTLSALMKLGNDVQFRANGGPVHPGQKYVVGENEPEIFEPEVPGNVIPLSALNNPATKPFATSLASLSRQQQTPSIPGLPDLSRIGVTMNNGTQTLPVYDANTNNPRIGSPLTATQRVSLHDLWQRANPVQLGQGTNDIPVSAGGRIGNYTTLADLTKKAIQDRTDAGNAMFGLNPYTMTPQDPSPQNLKSLADLRASLNRTDVMEEKNSLLPLLQQQKYENALALQDAKHSAKLSEIAARGTGNKGSNASDKQQQRVQKQIESYKKKMDEIFGKEGDSDTYRSYRRGLQNIINQAEKQGIEWDNASVGLDLVSNKPNSRPVAPEPALDMSDPRVKAALDYGYKPDEVAAYLAGRK